MVRQNKINRTNFLIAFLSCTVFKFEHRTWGHIYSFSGAPQEVLAREPLHGQFSHMLWQRLLLHSTLQQSLQWVPTAKWMSWLLQPQQIQMTALWWEGANLYMQISRQIHCGECMLDVSMSCTASAVCAVIHSCTCVRTCTWHSAGLSTGPSCTGSAGCCSSVHLFCSGCLHGCTLEAPGTHLPMSKTSK